MAQEPGMTAVTASTVALLGHRPTLCQSKRSGECDALIGQAHVTCSGALVLTGSRWVSWKSLQWLPLEKGRWDAPLGKGPKGLQRALQMIPV